MTKIEQYQDIQTYMAECKLDMSALQLGFERYDPVDYLAMLCKLYVSVDPNVNPESETFRNQLSTYLFDKMDLLKVMKPSAHMMENLNAFKPMLVSNAARDIIQTVFSNNDLFSSSYSSYSRKFNLPKEQSLLEFDLLINVKRLDADFDLKYGIITDSIGNLYIYHRSIPKDDSNTLESEDLCYKENNILSLFSSVIRNNQGEVLVPLFERPELKEETAINTLRTFFNLPNTQPEDQIACAQLTAFYKKITYDPKISELIHAMDIDFDTVIGMLKNTETVVQVPIPFEYQ